MSFRTALSNLAGVSVFGIANNYDVDDVPEILSRAQLPALLVLPIEIPDEHLRQQNGEGFRAMAFSDGARTITYRVTHLLLVAPVNVGLGMRSHLPDLIERIDDYFEALGNDVTLGDALELPARVRVEPGVYAHGGIAYYGCAFRHTWVIAV